ncbi:YdeI/OmpD-associated family protein [Tenacibaculum sp. IB213877]|uniref:YdeI/OmpD-associated family protein n=1 Tax=Tenacibaculum sp. IB213877 TaxID=3097351 RepID=UPI002A5A92C4|nr:DUF1801 domain-containing protein [Tenacibaculum sp. IB213877]MDY0779606.1 YdeI/OmpD-associated family protein [Tenacibaculum sp. IB213877]
MNIKVTEYIDKQDKWTQELTLLRSVLLQLSLDETIKWGAPVYVYKKKNVLGLSAFKNYCGIWFFQGGLLKDNQKVLINAQEGKTQAMRQWRFSSIKEIDINLVKTYVLESMENINQGKEIKPERKNKPLIIPKELQEALTSNEELQLKFNEFTLGKKREFTDYISEAKRDATKLSRLEKIIPMILNGIGLHDKYRNC